MIYCESKYNIVVKKSKDFVWLYNTYSGAFVKIESYVYRQFHNKEIDETKPCEEFEGLIKEGFIKLKYFNETDKILLNEKESLLYNSKEELSFVIAPTLACNLKCVYCYEKGISTKFQMTDEVLSDCVLFIIKKINNDTKKINITWFGGEPLLAYDKIIRFYELINYELDKKQVKIKTNIITNGILLDEEKLKTLLKKAHLKKIQITLDGKEEEYCRLKGATSQEYYRVLSNIKIALNYCKVSIRLNVDKSNFNDIKDVAKQLLKESEYNPNLNLYCARIMDYCGGSAHDNLFTQKEFDEVKFDFQCFICEATGKSFKNLLPKYRRTFCGLSKLMNLVIGPKGELYKCEHFVGKKDKVIGDIYNGVECSQKLKEFLNNQKPQKCIKCKLLPLCMGGCPAQKKDFNISERCNISMEYLKKLLQNFIYKSNYR